MKVIRFRLSIDELTERLEHFERQYEMPTAVFLDQYRAGQLEDSDEFAEWEETHFIHGLLSKRLASR